MLFGSASRGIPSFGDLSWKRPVVAASSGVLSANTLSPNTGVSFGQTLTKNSNGNFNLEPITALTTVGVGDRVLVASETAPKNGIYVVTTVGSASVPWKLTRATDSDSAIELAQGSTVYEIASIALWVAISTTLGDPWQRVPDTIDGTLSLIGGFLIADGWIGDSSNFDARIQRSAAETITIDDNAGGDLILTEIKGPASSTVSFRGRLQATGALTPAQITADQNNYNPTGWQNGGVSLLRLSSDAARNITGLVPPATVGGFATAAAGSIVWITNVGAFTITLKSKSGSSSADNRFVIAADYALGAGKSVSLFYEYIPGIASGWLIDGA